MAALLPTPLAASVKAAAANGPAQRAWHVVRPIMIAPPAVNYFDRVPKARILEALDAVGGQDLVSRYSGSKKSELAVAAERIFSGNFIAEAGSKERALAWVPDLMKFAAHYEPTKMADAGISGAAVDEVTEEAA